jgi:hypothetical protein
MQPQRSVCRKLPEYLQDANVYVSNLKVGMVAAALVHTIRLIIDKQCFPSHVFVCS